MAAPFPIYGPRWELALTQEMATEISLAAAREGMARSEWIRRACAAHLAERSSGAARGGKR
jgi:hypothetical protein